MKLTSMSTGDVASASFSNLDMLDTDAECASLKWIGTFTDEDQLYVLFNNNPGTVQNDVTIPAQNM